MFEYLAAGLQNVCNLECIFMLVAGTIVGVIFGCVPGLTGNMGLAIMLPISFTLDIVPAMSLLMGVYVGSVSGGLISAILIGIPGTPASVATTFDGVPMAQNGQAGRALGIGIFYSFLGTLAGFIVLVLIAPSLATLGLKFGYYEFFALGIFSLTVISSLVSGNVLKGLGSAAFGMAISMIGLAPIDSAKRFTFGMPNLSGGIQLIVLTVGLYAISSFIECAEQRDTSKTAIKTNYKMKGFGFTFKEFVENIWNFIRSSLLGIFIGILPGLGSNISNLVAYSIAKSRSKHSEEFGNGSMEGLVASESSNNATIGGTFTPLLTLGVPGDAATALILGAFTAYGITPGPNLYTNQGDLVYSIYLLLLLSSIAMMLIIRCAMPVFVKILEVPKYYLMPVIILLASVGAYGASKLTSDLWICLIFGIIAVFMKKVSIPISPMIVSFILTPMIETNLRRGLMAAPDRSILNFFSSPIFVVLIIATVAVVTYVTIKQIRAALRGGNLDDKEE